MNNTQSDGKLNQELWEKARAVANYKMHCIIFILANAFLWLVSIFLSFAFKVTWLWAIFPTAIWVIILIFQYYWIFKWNKIHIQKEYDKLLNKTEKKIIE